MSLNQPRHAYDTSPSPSPLRSRSPTLVDSRAGTEYGDNYSRHRRNGSRAYNGWEDYDNDRYYSRNGDSIAKASIAIGLFVAIAGFLHLRSKRKEERERQRQNVYSSSRPGARSNFRGHARRQEEWYQWKENGRKGRLVESNHTRMIEASGTHGGSRGIGGSEVEDRGYDDDRRRRT